MEKTDYKSLILKELDEGPASIGTLKKKCGQGNKITNLRKAFHRLLKDRVIEFSGYDSGQGIFKLDCIILKKSDSNLENPIYIKGLLDNPFNGDNYYKIRRIFKDRVELVNNIYREELKKLGEIMGKMPLEKGIAKGYIGPKKPYYRTKISTSEGKSEDKTVTYGDILKKYPNAQVWYLKKPFISQIGTILSQGKFEEVDFTIKPRLEYDGRYGRGNSLIDSYKSHFHYLPITPYGEEWLFKQLVIGVLKEKEEKEKRLWELATVFTESLPKFTDRLEIVYMQEEIDDDDWSKLVIF